ncbi:MAG: hypothetical protein ABJQ29_10965 [Luteolibacter sp.]
MKARIFTFLLLSLAVASAHHLERVWTDDQGRSVKAILASVEDGKAMLLLPDGRELPYPLEKLSKIDQAFIEKFGMDGHDEAEGTETEEAVIDNFNDPWPDRVSFEGDPEIVTVIENAEEKSFIYESANYRYNCDVRLSKSVVKGFAVLFEATHQFTRELPLAVNGGKKTDGKYQIFLFESEETYFKAGGPPGSAGVFIGGKNIVMVPLTSLGVRPVGSSYMLDRDKTNKTLPHELLHQLTPNRYYAEGARGWFTEGLAEYVAVTPYRSGSFNVKTNFKPIVEYVTAYGKKGDGGRAIGEEIKLGSLRDFMLMPYSDFTANPQVNYGCGLLITNYFFHMDREEDGARIKNFLKALNAGKKGDEALEVLLDGQTWPELEEEIAKAYSRKGVDFTFSE